MPQPSTSTPRLALVAALVTAVLWASAFVGIRAAGTELSAGALALGRLATGTVALGILVALRGWVRPSRRDLALIAASGLLWFAFYSVALNEAERNLDAGTASMLIGLGPIFIALLAGMFLGEGLPGRLLAGLAVAFAGVVVIGVATSSAPVPGSNPTLGVVLCIAAAVAYAVAVTLQKPALRNVAPVQLTWMACAIGTLACLPFAPSLASELTTASTSTIGWMLYLGLFPTSIALTTWAYALSHTPAGRLGATTYLVPPIVIVLGWQILGEVPGLAVIAGGALCIGGVIVARSKAIPWRQLRRAGAGGRARRGLNSPSRTFQLSSQQGVSAGEHGRRAGAPDALRSGDDALSETPPNPDRALAEQGRHRRHGWSRWPRSPRLEELSRCPRLRPTLSAHPDRPTSASGTSTSSATPSSRPMRPSGAASSSARMASRCGSTCATRSTGGSRRRATRTSTYRCSCPRASWRPRRSMSKGSARRSPGSPTVAPKCSPSASRSGPPLRQWSAPSSAT